MTKGARISDSVKIVIGIPMYNELPVVSYVLKEIEDCLASSPYSFEIVVVNDGSTDGTQHVLERCTFITLFTEKERQGVGSALATTLDYCRDTDATHFLWHVGNARVPLANSLAMLLALISSNRAYAHGSRFIAGGTWARARPSRFLGVLLGNKLVRRICPSAPSDVTCGIRALRLDRWNHQLNTRLRNSNYGAEQLLCQFMIQSPDMCFEHPMQIIEHPSRSYSHFKWFNMMSVLWSWLSFSFSRNGFKLRMQEQVPTGLTP